MAVITSGKWDILTNTGIFDTSSAPACSGESPLAAPDSLPSSGVSSSYPASLTWYLRLLKQDGSPLIVNGASLFALSSLSLGATGQTVLTKGGAAHPVFDPAAISFSNGALDATLLPIVGGASAFKEADFLGYQTDSGLPAAPLIGVVNLGKVRVSALTTDDSGQSIADLTFGSEALTRNTISIQGVVSAGTPVAWDTLTSTAVFGTSAGPVSAPAVLPTTGVANDTGTGLTWFARVLNQDGSVLMVNGATLFPIASFSFGATNSTALTSAGQLVGQASLEPANLTFRDDLLPAALMRQVAGGPPYRQVDILGYKLSGAKPALISDISLGGVFGTSLGVSGASFETPNVSLQLTYASAEIQNNTLDGTGAIAATSTGAWDLLANIAQFDTGSGTASLPAAAPSTLPAQGVSTHSGARQYFVQFGDPGLPLLFGTGRLIEVDSFSFGASRTAGTATQRVGMPSLHDLELVLPSGAWTSTLFADLAAGESLPELDIFGYLPGGSQTLVSQYNFGNVLVDGLTRGDGHDTVSLAYGSVNIQNQGNVSINATDAVNQAAWDQVTLSNIFNDGVSTSDAPPSGDPTIGSGPHSNPGDGPSSSSFYIRFDTSQSSFLTVNGASLFNLSSFSMSAANPALFPAGTSGVTSLDGFSFTLADSGMANRLFSELTQGGNALEIDVMEFSGQGGNGGALTRAFNFGNAYVSDLAIGPDGGGAVSITYGSIQMVDSQETNLSPATWELVAPVAWDAVAGTAQFSSGGNLDAATVPLSLPGDGSVATMSPPLVDYYVRFLNSNGSTLIANGASLFSLEAFSLDTTEAITLSSAGRTNVALPRFAPADLTYKDSNLTPLLFQTLAAGGTFKEIDILGYLSAGGGGGAGHLVNEYLLGRGLGTALSTDSEGGGTLIVSFGEISLTNNVVNPNGTVSPGPTAAWNSANGTPTFTGASGTVPATLPGAGVSTAAATPLSYYARFVNADGTTLTADQSTLFSLSGVSFGANHTLPPSGSGAGGGIGSFDDTTFTFQNADLGPTLFGDLTAGGLFSEIDILGYQQNGGTPVLVTDVSLGLGFGGDLQLLEQSGGTFSVTPAAMEFQQFGQVACFAAGTRIAGVSGAVAVEDLRPGDQIVTAAGGEAPVVWIGHRPVHTRRHPRPENVWPVRIRAHAFGPGRPCRDLVLSPDHAVYVDRVLIPVRYLIDGAAIVQESWDEVTYFHVELPEHDILLAEGLPVESYLETGGRSSFANGGGVMAMHPDFAREAGGCAPLVVHGPTVGAVRKRLHGRAWAMGLGRGMRRYVERRGTA